jgi:hypothetical protein
MIWSKRQNTQYYKKKNFGDMEETLLMVFWKKKPDILYHGRRTISWFQTLEWMLKLLDYNKNLNNMIIRKVFMSAMVVGFKQQ